MNWRFINWPAVSSVLLGLLAFCASLVATVNEDFYMAGHAIVTAILSVAAAMLSLRDR